MTQQQKHSKMFKRPKQEVETVSPIPDGYCKDCVHNGRYCLVYKKILEYIPSCDSKEVKKNEKN